MQIWGEYGNPRLQERAGLSIITQPCWYLIFYILWVVLSINHLILFPSFILIMTEKSKLSLKLKRSSGCICLYNVSHLLPSPNSSSKTRQTSSSRFWTQCPCSAASAPQASYPNLHLRLSRTSNIITSSPSTRSSTSSTRTLPNHLGFTSFSPPKESTQ